MPRPKVDRGEKRGREEEKLQEACAEYLTLQCKCNPLFKGLLWWHVPNGGKRTAAEGAKFKRMGVKPGVSDLHFVLPSRFNTGRFGAIELKIPPNKPEPAQTDFIEAVDAIGARSGVAYNINQFVELITDWLEQEWIA
jgi:hypothetical protein